MMRTMWRRQALATMVAVSVVMLWWSSTAWAQYGEPVKPFISTTEQTTSWVLPVSIGLALTSTGVTVTLFMYYSGRAELYLRQNNQALAQHISTGGGETVRDLAEIYQVDKAHRAAFATMLRQRRKTLLPLLDPERLTDRRARLFFLSIYLAARERELVPRIRI